jgi:Uncharacterized protein conserved in bacteria (DUF2188)
MNKITFKIVKHDDGWVYEANGARSQSFRTREAARKAARLAASAGMETTLLSHEDKNDEWYDDTG